MRMIRSLLAAATAAVLALPLAAGTAQAQKVTVGKILGGNGFHIPSYVAMDRGFFKDEGLDASFVTLVGRALVTATLAGSVDLNPLPSGGAQAALAGADIRYIVGQSLRSQWVIVSRQDINSAQELKGKVLGYGRIGAADYDEGAAVLERAFNLRVGRDYKVITFQTETDRVAALVNNQIDAALISVPHVPRALNAGLKVLVRTGEHIQRAGGTFWARKEFIDKNPDVMPRFIRAIARGVMDYRDNKEGAIKTLRDHLGVESDKDAEVIWQETRLTFGAELPPEQFAEILESRRQSMISAKQWAKDKPLPNPEQFVLREVLDKTLADMKYEPTKIGGSTN